MKTAIRLFIIVLGTGFFVKCTKSADPSATSTISLKMSVRTSNGSNIINARAGSGSSARGSAGSAMNITLSEVKVNVRDIRFEFDQDDRHFHENEFKKDSAFSGDNDAKLKGPFLVDLMNAGTFVDQVVASVTVPNAKYERVRFKLVPDSVAGDMMGKSIMITGKIDTIPFTFWHKRDANFGARFNDHNANDSTMTTTGSAVTVAIHFELDKIMNAFNDGADLTKAVDGNKDGVITIDPDNDDGNKWLADQIMMLLIRHARCERQDQQ